MENNVDYIFNKAVAKTIKTYRTMKHMSLEDVVKKMKNPISRQSLFKYENNLARIKTQTFLDICHALNLDPQKAFRVINEFASEMEYDIDNLNFDNATMIDIDSDTVQIPVLGTIKAGIAIEAQQDILEYIDIPKSWTKGGKSFYGLKISGDSMYPKYTEKDIVIFEHTEDYTIANNKDCAVMVNGYDATFKNVSINENGITLIPYNPNNSDNYQPTFYNKEQISSLPVKIVGIAREKRTRL